MEDWQAILTLVSNPRHYCFTLVQIGLRVPILGQSKIIFCLVLLIQGNLPNLAAVTQTPLPLPPASHLCHPHSLNRVLFPLKIKDRRTQVKPSRVRPRPSSTPLCLQVTATPACPTTPGCRECPVPSSTAPLSSCPQHPQSSTVWAHPASTSTRLDTASTHMAQVNVTGYLIVILIL